MSGDIGKEYERITVRATLEGLSARLGFRLSDLKVRGTWALLAVVASVPL